jgi:cysteine desulfurase
MKVKESARVEKLRDFLVSKILKNISGTSVNGFLEVGRVMPGGAVKSLPNILNVSFDGIESEALVLYLDAAGIAVSGKSACKSSTGGASHVIMAIGKAGEKEAGAIRFSLGRETRREDIVRVFKELARIIELLRSMNIQSDN